MRIPRSSEELQSYVFGIMSGIAKCVGVLMFVSAIFHVKWQMVSTLSYMPLAN